MKKTLVRLSPALVAAQKNLRITELEKDLFNWNGGDVDYQR
jgi:hypothetical protein